MGWRKPRKKWRIFWGSPSHTSPVWKSGSSKSYKKKSEKWVRALKTKEDFIEGSRRNNLKQMPARRRRLSPYFFAMIYGKYGKLDVLSILSSDDQNSSGNLGGTCYEYR